MLGVSHAIGHFVTKLSPNTVNKKLLFLQEMHSYNYVLVLCSSILQFLLRYHVAPTVEPHTWGESCQLRNTVRKVVICKMADSDNTRSK